MNSDDRMLLEGWKARRDPECLNRLIRKYAGLVHNAALRITQNATDADDVAQECIITLAQKPPTESVPIGAWLHRVATRRAIDHQRSEKRRRVRDDKWAAHPMQAQNRDTDEHDQLRSTVDAAIDILPDLQRTAIIAHFIEGQTHEQIAEMAGVSRPAVTQRIQNGLESLRQKLVPAAAALDAATLSGLIGPPHNTAAHVALLYKLEGIHTQLGSGPVSQQLAKRPVGWLNAGVGLKLGLLSLLAVLIGVGVYQVVGSSPQQPETVEQVSVAAAPASAEQPAPETIAPPPPAPEPETLENEPVPQVQNPISEPESAPAETAATSASIDGRVFDRVTNRGLPSAVVNVLGPKTDGVFTLQKVEFKNGGIADPSRQILTDGNGNYSLKGLAKGEYALILTEIPGYPATRAGRSMRTVILDGEDVRVDFDLDRSGTLAGRISVNGAPRANMTVLLDSQPQLDVTEITSDAKGNYRVDGLGDYEGSLRIRSQVAGTLRATPYVSAEVKSGMITRADFDFLAGTASIEGNVFLHERDGNILPIKGKVVVSYAYVDNDQYNVENMDMPTDENGHFLVEGLWGGRVTVGLYPSIRGGHRHRYTFVLTDGERAQQDFHFYETRINVRIARMPKDTELDVWLVAIPGRVETIDGSPAVRRDFVESQQRCVGGVRPDGSGGGEGFLGGLPPGEYTIMASGVLGSHTLINHAAGDEYYRRGRTVKTYATLPEGTDQISLEMSFPEEP